MLLQALHTETDNHLRPTSSFCGEKLEYLQRTHTDARKTCKRHRERPPGGPRVASDLNIGPSFCETTVKSTITLPPPSNSALNKCLFRLVSRSLLRFLQLQTEKPNHVFTDLLNDCNQSVPNPCLTQEKEKRLRVRSFISKYIHSFRGTLLSQIKGRLGGWMA